MEAKVKGTYAGVRYDLESKSYISSLASKFDNPIKEEDIHSTLLFSRKFLPNYEPLGEVNEIVKPKKYNIFKSDDKNVLVLEVTSKWLEERHKSLMETHGATWDFPSYIPHITLSYDVGDIEIPKLSKKDLKTELIISEEYSEELNLDWKNS